MKCPNSAATGCRCPEHHLGLMAYAPDPQAYAEQLERAQPVRLRVVTMGRDERVACTGTMTCSCEDCVMDRASRNRGGLADHQPWTPRPSRRAA